MNDRSAPLKIVIIGGGFGGLYAAKRLTGAADVTLIDRKNHHTFQPLLYQVALAVLSPADDRLPAAPHPTQERVTVKTLLGEVTGFDTRARRVQLAGGMQVGYDYLIVAAGARHAYFGHDDWERNAPGLKTIEDAVEIRRRLLLAFEKAERDALLGGRRDPPTFAIVGGGPTGVELAGAIADLARMALAKDFKAIDTTTDARPAVRRRPARAGHVLGGVVAPSARRSCRSSASRSSPTAW